MLNDENFNGTIPENNEVPISAEPVQDPFAPHSSTAPQQQTGSYYSPRSGYRIPGGGAVPPIPPQEPPAKQKKKSHKGLKALGVFAAIAFLSYASIQCYRFASENEAIRNFFKGGSQPGNSLELEASNSGAESNAAPDSFGSTASDDDSTGKSDTPTTPVRNWIELAARKDAMSIPDIVDKMMPASVGVASTFVITQNNYGGMFGYGGQSTREMNGTGTGIIMSEDGYVITNAHVIYDSEYKSGVATKVQVVLNDKYYQGETQLEATVVGYDTEEDIAVLKVQTSQKLVAAEFGSSDDLRVGELVIAIGNPLGFDLFGTVTTGIVSALDRTVSINDTKMKLIQTDTAINSGNSGGPLINSYGQVIGITSAKLSNTYSGSASIEGLCFAIPMTHAQQVVDDLINYSYVRGKPLIGFTGIDVSEQVSQAYGIPVGIYVQSVTEGGAAELAGLRKGDVIIGVDGKTVTNFAELSAVTDTHKAGDTIRVTVTRSGRDMEFTLVLQERRPTTAD